VCGLGRNFDGTRATTFSGSLVDALAPLVATGAAGGPRAAYFDAVVAALDHFHRPGASVVVDLVGALDDTSLDPESDAFELRALALDSPDLPLFTAVRNHPAPRMEAFLAQFPTADGELISEHDFGAFMYSGTPWDPLFVDPCIEAPLAMPVDCDASYVFPGGGSQPLPRCGSGALPCWELRDDPSCGAGTELFVRRWDRGLPSGTQVVAQCAVTP